MAKLTSLAARGECYGFSTQLILDTTSAHAYNFILLNVGTGNTITIQAKVSSNSSGSGGAVAISDAMFGLGSVTVDSVRLVNSFSF